MNKLRDLQLAEVEILKAVTELCDQLGLRYFLNSGTLLGAVRHRGFIPWDDDIDLAMPFHDYAEFLKSAQKMLGDRYFVQNMSTESNFHFSFTRIRLNGTTYMNSYHCHWDVHQGVWIDIFPLIPIGGKLDFKFKRGIISLCNYIQMDNFIDSHLDEFTERLGKAGMFFIQLFFRIPLEKRVRLHERLIYRLGSTGEKPYLSVLWGSITRMYPKEMFAKTKEVEFEHGLYSAPWKTEEYLTQTYGDYMKLPPENERHGHGKNMILDLQNDYHRYLQV